MPTDAKRRSTPAKSKKTGPLISNERLREIHAAMLRCRLLEERAQILAGRGGLPAFIGHEAAAVGVSIGLRRQDTVVPSTDSLILAYLKGIPVSDLLARVRMKSPTVRRKKIPASYRSHAAVNLLIPVSDSAALAGIAAGIALANQRKKAGDIVVAWLEDAPAERSWRAALEFAASHALPILYIRQAGAVLKEKTSGIPAIPVDENDAIAVYRVAQEAIARARHGEGPTILDCRTWPPGVPARKAAKDRRPEDPIQFMEEYLTEKGLFTTVWKRKLVEQFNRELDAAAALARAAYAP